jgi:hypothetical protein
MLTAMLLPVLRVRRRGVRVGLVLGGVLEAGVAWLAGRRGEVLLVRGGRDGAVGVGVVGFVSRVRLSVKRWWLEAVLRLLLLVTSLLRLGEALVLRLWEGSERVAGRDRRRGGRVVVGVCGLGEAGCGAGLEGCLDGWGAVLFLWGGV